MRIRAWLAVLGVASAIAVMSVGCGGDDLLVGGALPNPTPTSAVTPTPACGVSGDPCSAGTDCCSGACDVFLGQCI